MHPLLLQAKVPAASQLADWAAGRGLAAIAAGGAIVLLAIALLIRIAARRSRATGFEDADSNFLEAFRNSPHVLAVFLEGAEFGASPRWKLYQAGCRELSFHLVGSDRVDANLALRVSTAGRISESQMNAVRRAMDRAADELSQDLAALASVSGSPGETLRWLGLLGAIGVLAEGILDPANASESFPQLLLPALLPGAVAILVSLIVDTSARARRRRAAASIARLRLFPAELSVMMDRLFVDHSPATAELPSLNSLGAPAFPAFSLLPSEGAAQMAP